MGAITQHSRRLGVLLAAGAVVVAGAGLTTASASGDEARGRTLKASLSGDKERPGPGDPDGSGNARISLKDDRVCFELSWSNIDAPTAAHIHVGARDVAGPVVTLLLSASGGLGAPVSLVGGCTTANPALVQAIHDDPHAYYVNVHNAAYPAGAIRGQLHH